MKSLRPFLFALLLIITQTTTKAQVNTSDSLALVTFYKNMNGPNWYNKSGWLQGPVNSWFGVTVTGNRVTGLYFNYDNNITGNLSPAFGNLTALTSFYFVGNNITGAIPSSFSNLSNLTEFTISYTHLSGSIPSSLSKLISLKVVTLENNYLTGSIPSSLGKLIKLQSLNLQHNQLTGIIPSSLGKLPDLTVVQLDFNNLTGSIPSSFGAKENLQLFGASNNQLSGTIPAFISTHLTDLFLGYNHLTGHIPQIGSTTYVSELTLDHNELTGSIPVEFAKIKGDIKALDHNHLTGSIPAEFWESSNTFSLTLNDNQLSGKVPTSLQTISYLQIFNNHFTFDGIDSIAAVHSPYYPFNYAPQATIKLNFSAGGTYGKLSVHAGGSLSDNTYRWYKNDQLIQTKTGDSTFTPVAIGTYFVTINNAIATELQLHSDTVTVSNACSTAPVNLQAINISSTSATLSWDASNGATQYQVKYKVAGTANFTTVNTSNTSLALSSLLPNTKYVWKLRSKCSADYSPFSASKNFTTASNPGRTAVSSSSLKVDSRLHLVVYPNPGKELHVDFMATKQYAYALTLFDTQGKLIDRKEGLSNTGINNISFNVNTLSAGTYYIKLQYDGHNVFTKEWIKEKAGK